MPEFKRLSDRLKIQSLFAPGWSFKRCCFLSETYIQTVKSVKVRGHSGKVFFRAMPPWETNRVAYRRMWIALREKILEAMWEKDIQPGDRRSQGSNSGQNEEWSFSGDEESNYQLIRLWLK